MSKEQKRSFWLAFTAVLLLSALLLGGGIACLRTERVLSGGEGALFATAEDGWIVAPPRLSEETVARLTALGGYSSVLPQGIRLIGLVSVGTVCLLREGSRALAVLIGGEGD